ALFAERVKNRAWTAETLGDLGGADGIGIRFLDETFEERSAPPEHRLHRDAASRVLAALLPGPGAEIKGHLRSHHELLVAAGCTGALRFPDAHPRLRDSAPDADGPGRSRGSRELGLGHASNGRRDPRRHEILSAHPRLSGAVDPRVAGTTAEGKAPRPGRADA